MDKMAVQYLRVPSRTEESRAQNADDQAIMSWNMVYGDGMSYLVLRLETIRKSTEACEARWAKMRRKRVVM